MLVNISAFISGVWFAVGLSLSGMLNPFKVLAFLDITHIETWDPSLLMLLFGGLIPNTIAYKFIIKHNPPVLKDEHSLPRKTEIDWKLLIGSVLFGISWGWTGVCPGPGWIGLTALNGWRIGGLAAGWWGGMEVARLVR